MDHMTDSLKLMRGHARTAQIVLSILVLLEALPPK